ncbi:MAG: hypothetical protein AB1454_08840 [Candidatus Auribacterota bacterium]|jgi:uncharacterized lipoprotein YehR (DUF1307 family)
MKNTVILLLVLFVLTVAVAGCYNTERHARRFQQSVENVFLDGTGIN